ncbi:unnamed protein product, partial [Brenthis ino]
MDNQQSTSGTKLEGWSKEEKFELLQALKEYGSQNIDQIRNYITTKNEEEVRKAMQFYKEKALLQSNSQQKKVKKINNAPVIPLASWAKFITDSYGYEELQTETATALRIIADFEIKPPGVCTEKIDFRKVYHMLADATEGKQLPNDKLITAVFDKCIIETALTSKAFIKSTTYKQILQSINTTDIDINVFSKPTDNIELATLRHLTSQKCYNPLNITENYLKPSSYTR